MRPSRLVVAVAAAGFLLVGCTDPSPAEPTTATSDPTASSAQTTDDDPTDDATTEPTTEPTTSARGEDPVFGTPSNPSAGVASVCLDTAGEDVAMLTSLTAVGPITLTAVTLEPAMSDLQIVEEFVRSDVEGGLVIDDYPPNEGEAIPVGDGYELAAGETVMVGVAVTVPEAEAAQSLTLGVTYTGPGGASSSLSSGYRLTLSPDCSL